MFTEPEWQAFWVAAGLTAAGGLGVARAVRRGAALSAEGGLHFNVFVLFGVGPLAYTFVEIGERAPHADVCRFFPPVGGPVLAGYLAWLAFGTWRPPPSAGPPAATARWVPNSLLTLMAVCSVVGYFGSQLEVATAGVGTVFVVARWLLYPTVVVAALRADLRDGPSLLLAGGTVAVAFGLAFFSGWRSELILLIVFLTLAGWYRAPRWTPAVLAAGAAAVAVVFPFQQYKKQRYEEFEADPVRVVVESQKVGLTERVEAIAAFVAERTNALREGAYVANGLETEQLTHRFGETYLEAVLQLIPRVLWPDKPSYNQTTNYYLPRAIGLVGEEDTGTSWGVHVFAEFAWNFPAWHLVWFVPLAFAVARGLDGLAARLFPGVGRMVAQCTLFAITFNLVGVVNTTTYVAWLFILIWLMTKAVAGDLRPAARPRPPAGAAT